MAPELQALCDAAPEDAWTAEHPERRDWSTRLSDEAYREFIAQEWN